MPETSVSNKAFYNLSASIWYESNFTKCWPETAFIGLIDDFIVVGLETLGKIKSLLVYW